MKTLEEDYRDRLFKIRDIIEAIEQRAMAVDGPVTNTREEMTDKELIQIYKLTKIKFRL